MTTTIAYAVERMELEDLRRRVERLEKLEQKVWLQDLKERVERLDNNAEKKD